MPQAWCRGRPDSALAGLPAFGRSGRRADRGAAAPGPSPGGPPIPGTILAAAAVAVMNAIGCSKMPWSWTESALPAPAVHQ